MTAPDPRTIVRHYLERPIEPPAQAASRAAWAARTVAMHRISFPQAPPPRAGIRVAVLLSAVFWLALGTAYIYWPTFSTSQTVAEVAR